MCLGVKCCLSVYTGAKFISLGEPPPIEKDSQVNTYTDIIAEGLQVDMESAKKIQDFINNWYDGFRWGSATKKQIIKIAKEAQADMADPSFAEILAYIAKAGA